MAISARMKGTLVAACLVAGCAGLSHRAPPTKVTPVAEIARGGTATAGRDAGCAKCHAAESREWETSLHHASFSDGDFQRSFAVEPLDFCFSCHAPQAAGRDDLAGAARGVGCASCHPTAHGATARVEAGRSCDHCHEFSFPDRAEPMQKTVTEHRNGSLGKSCVDCHMRPGKGGLDHRFWTARDPELLRRSLAVDRARMAAGEVEIALRTVDVGHAFPTGDLFRRIVVRVWTEDAHGVITSDNETILGRRFDHQHTGMGGSLEVRDDRIFGTRTVRVPVPENAARASVRIRYERVAVDTPQMTSVFDSTPLFERDLTPQPQQ
ncbi:MAG: hypothetical protein HOO96_30390 [Polyangiaceae bacterium]|nr:hypothetical protein [Polyangiaceae bacterium]